MNDWQKPSLRYNWIVNPARGNPFPTIIKPDIDDNLHPRVPVHPVPDDDDDDDIDFSILDPRHSLSPSQYRIPRSHGKSYDAFLLATNTESLQKVLTIWFIDQICRFVKMESENIIVKDRQGKSGKRHTLTVKVEYRKWKMNHYRFGLIPVAPEWRLGRGWPISIIVYRVGLWKCIHLKKTAISSHMVWLCINICKIDYFAF